MIEEPGPDQQDDFDDVLGDPLPVDDYQLSSRVVGGHRYRGAQHND
jgi:hypothetical protein